MEAAEWVPAAVRCGGIDLWARTPIAGWGLLKQQLRHWGYDDGSLEKMTTAEALAAVAALDLEARGQEYRTGERQAQARWRERFALVTGNEALLAHWWKRETDLLRGLEEARQQRRPLPEIWPFGHNGERLYNAKDDLDALYLAVGLRLDWFMRTETLVTRELRKRIEDLWQTVSALAVTPFLALMEFGPYQQGELMASGVLENLWAPIEEDLRRIKMLLDLGHAVQKDIAKAAGNGVDLRAFLQEQVSVIEGRTDLQEAFVTLCRTGYDPPCDSEEDLKTLYVAVAGVLLDGRYSPDGGPGRVCPSGPDSWAIRGYSCLSVDRAHPLWDRAAQYMRSLRKTSGEKPGGAATETGRVQAGVGRGPRLHLDLNIFKDGGSRHLLRDLLQDDRREGIDVTSARARKKYGNGQPGVLKNKVLRAKARRSQKLAYLKEIADRIVRVPGRAHYFKLDIPPAEIE